MDIPSLIDLNEIEKQTYEQLYNNFKSKSLEIKDIKDAVIRMKNAVTHELIRTSVEDKEKIIKIQARLENLMGLELLFDGSEMAERQFQLAMQNLNKQKERNNL